MRGSVVGCIVGAAGALAAAFLWQARRRLLGVTVHESSMEPTLHSGDHVLVRRVGGASLRAGQVVVVRRADAPDSLVIKRIAALPGDLVPDAVRSAVMVPQVPAGNMVLLGDNPDHSTDSRLLGFYRLEDVVGVLASSS